MLKSGKLSYFLLLLIGAIFVFSALAKGLDLFAVTAKINDYANILNITIPGSLSEIGGMCLIAIELIMGLCMIRGIYSKLIFYGTIILLLFFLCLTLVVAVSGRFEDCGCFGSVYEGSPLMSFVKNVILVIFTLLTYNSSVIF